MADKIDINSAPVTELTQLPGVSKDIAYNIVNHRARHGFFVSFEELRMVKGFPVEKLEAVRERAVLVQPAEDRPGETVPPSRNLEKRIESRKTGTEAYTNDMRATRRPDRLHDSRDHSHRDSEGKKSA